VEAMLGISIAVLISTSKNALSFLLLLMSYLQQNLRKGQNKFCLEVRGVKGGREWGRRMGGRNSPNVNKWINKKRFLFNYFSTSLIC
jgi:hypothetical protein